MSIQLIERYHEEIKRKRNAGAVNEQSLRNSFYNLIDQYARPHNLDLIAELGYRVAGQKNLVYPDGTLRDALQNNWGFWESKDTKDDLDQEIANKTAVGYPLSNTLFEDSQTAVLYQANAEVERVSILDENALHALLTKFVTYESPEVRAFREAIERFSQDVPALAQELRAIMRQQYQQNKAFKKEAQAFLKLCQESINPSLEMADIREMMVQHVLTQDIFLTIFDEAQFHQENNIAQRLGQVVNTFYKRAVRKQIEGKIGVYYDVIKSRASQIADHHEKQRFLKVLYETFYKAYNPKAADRLGIVYTPNEIVRFMVEATDTLLHQQFGRGLGAPNVHILDPATGTGTYITELIEYLSPHQLQQKYDHELHCNEVSILPYYIANLNIEYSYQQKMGEYRPFNNAVFVDTLDNMGFGYTGKQLSLFALAEENLERIRAQNEREISVIIGNPPYNANQLNENENNKNREYEEIDKRIKATYVKQSTAQKTKVYDMYARFYRWATDRLGEDGVIAFVTNRSFINARTFDGFRKMVSQEFDTIYVLDLGGDVRANPKLSGPKHNVFAIQTGVAICFLVRKQQTPQGQPAHLYYARRPEMETAKEKLAYLNHTPFQRIPWQLIQPDKNHNWINLTDNDWDDLIPTATKRAKGKNANQKAHAIFRKYSTGYLSGRDEWVVDYNNDNLIKKVRYFLKEYNSREAKTEYDTVIKWSRNLKRRFKQGNREHADRIRIRQTLYRPYCTLLFYDSSLLIDERGLLDDIFKGNNIVICVRYGNRQDFSALATLYPPSYSLYSADPCQYFPLYHYDALGNQQENITDWALAQFRARYPLPSDRDSTESLGHFSLPQLGEGGEEQRSESGGGELGDTITETKRSLIEKSDIFHYVYAVLHHPAYRQKYKLNLKREFPRIPFYDDFWQWANWGQQLLALHLHYETIDPYPLHQDEQDPEKVRTAYKAKLKAQPDKGVIILDTYTSLHGVPAEAWAYKLGNRSAIEWVLDRYKERKPRDPTIRERFNTYRFLDYKADVIELLGRVVRVSVETQAIIAQMPT